MPLKKLSRARNRTPRRAACVGPVKLRNVVGVLKRSPDAQFEVDACLIVSGRRAIAGRCDAGVSWPGPRIDGTQ